MHLERLVLGKEKGLNHLERPGNTPKLIKPKVNRWNELATLRVETNEIEKAISSGI